MALSQSEPSKPLTRRFVLGAIVLGVGGVVTGKALQGGASTALSSLGSGLAQYLPGGDRFRIYTVINGFPSIPKDSYRLKVSGLFLKGADLSYNDLLDMPQTHFDHRFQCVTGWSVPNVPWRGVLLEDLLKVAGPMREAQALEFYSYDGVYTESLTLDQVQVTKALVVTHMYGAPLTQAHGGPVRLFVPSMYGYKSIKWLSEIRAVSSPTPGYWEQQGYPVNAWTSSNGSLGGVI